MAVLFNEIHAREWAWRRDKILDLVRLMELLGVDEADTKRDLVDSMKAALEAGFDDGDTEVPLSGAVLKEPRTQATRMAARNHLRQLLPKESHTDDTSDAVLTGAVEVFLDLLGDYVSPEVRDAALRSIADAVGSVQLVEWGRVGDEWLVLPASQFGPSRGLARTRGLSDTEFTFTGVVGRLLDIKDLTAAHAASNEQIRKAQGWVEDRIEYFRVALPEVQRIVLTRSGVDRVDEQHWANAVERIEEDGISADAPYIRQIVEEAMSPFLGMTTARTGSAFGSIAGDSGRRGSWIDIDLPDLESESAVDIVEDNLKAMQAIYFAATLEDLKFFQVMDKLLEMFNVGVLPFGKGSAGDKIYYYWKHNFNRFTELERHNMYARALGRPGGDVGMGTPNRQFQDLWLRFISSVSEWRRQVSVDDLLRSGRPYTVSSQQVRKSARDLAANLSLFGYGIAHYAAAELQNQINQVLSILRDDEVKAAYGARDVWQVIDQVATLELGGARNSVRYRTMAQSGAIVIRWLAENAKEISRTGYGTVLGADDLQPATGNGQVHDPLDAPTNFDLIEACEQYLAVTGTPEARVGEYAQPSLGPDLTSRPIQIPGVARDVFESVGVSPGEFGLN